VLLVQLAAAAAAGVSDAEAFLHERLGDLEAALRLHMAAVEKTNSQLVTALMSGRIPVLQLPGSWGVGNAGVALASRPGSSKSRDVNIKASLIAKEDESKASNTSSSLAAAEQVQWGLAALLQQLKAVQDAVQPAASASTEAAPPAAAAAAAAAAVATSLLQQLDPTAAAAANSHPHQQQYQYQQQALQHPYLLSQHGGVGASSSAMAQQSTCCVCVDLHKAWMAELSPRLKLKGLGCSTVGYSPLQSASGGFAGVSNAAAAAAVELPQELLAAWQALQAALAFCKRNTKSSSSSSSSSTASRQQRHSSSSSKKQNDADEVGGGRQLWFGLMDVYVVRVRSLQTSAGASTQQQQHVSQYAAADPQLLESLTAVAARQLPPAALPKVLLAAAAALARSVAHDLFRLLLDEVVCVMADHLPLLDIVGRVLQQHGSEHFGEFRSTLLGLFGATAYESAIMTAANR
jgi:hypothetical protein